MEVFKSSIAIGLFALAGAARGNTAPPDEVDSRLLHALGRRVEIFRNHPDTVWPGFDLSRRPLLVYRADRWALLMNHPDAQQGFGTLPGDWPELGMGITGQWHPGRYGALAGQLAFNFEVGNVRLAAIGLPDNEGTAKYVEARAVSLAGEGMEPRGVSPQFAEQNDSKISRRTAVFRAPTDTAITVDGAHVPTGQRVSREFEHLRVTGTEWELHVDTPGTLRIGDTQLRVELIERGQRAKK